MDNGGKGLDTSGASGWFIVSGSGVLSPQPVLTSAHTSVCDHGHNSYPTAGLQLVSVGLL